MSHHGHESMVGIDHAKHLRHHAKHEMHHAGHLFVEKAAEAHKPGAGHHGEGGGHHVDEAGGAHAAAEADGAGGAHATAGASDAGHHDGRGPGLAGDVLGAAAIGLDVGGIMARRRNEDKLVISDEEKKKRTKEGLVQAGLIGGAAVGGMALGKGLEALGVPGGGVAGVGLTVGAAGAATADKEMSRQDRLKVAVAAGGGAAILGGAHELAAAGAGKALGHGELGFGVGAVVGRVAGAALVAKSGQRGAEMKNALGEGVALVAAGVGLRAGLGAAAPVPLGVINEYKRKGLEFSGGHVLALGTRQLAETKEASGEGKHVQQVLHLEREDAGVQVRVGGGAVLMPVGAAMGSGAGPVGAVVGGAVGSAVGGLAGIGGNLGITKKGQMNTDEAGVQQATGEKLKGFSGGFDVVGLQWLNLDTGKMTNCRVEIDENGEYTIENGKSIKIFGFSVWSFSDASWRAKLQKGKQVMLLLKIPKAQALVWVPAEVTTSWKNCVSVKYGEGHNEVHRLISRKSKELCRPVLPIQSDPVKESKTALPEESDDAMKLVGA